MKNKSLLIEWLNYIQSLNLVMIDLNLNRIREVAIALNLIPLNIYTILVGGTNGKGSTCRLLENILLLNNIKVGLYTSPHVLRYNERIRVLGQELSDDIHVQVMSIVEKARGSVSLTYFEFTTLSALYIFKQCKLDVVILEVGLGGRLDATNIVNPNISVITNIAIDHIEFLGKTRSQIAIEKSGIFRTDKPAIIGEVNYPVIIDEIAKYTKTTLFVRGRDWDFRCHSDTWIWIDLKNSSKCLKNLPIPFIPLENAAIVLSILPWLPFKVSQTSIFVGLRQTVVLGRFQIVRYDPLIILDVGHNPHAALYTMKRLSRICRKKKIRSIRAIVGMLGNKDIQGTIYYLSKLVNTFYCAQLSTPLSATTQQLRDCCINFNVYYFDNIVNAWEKAMIDSDFNDCILVFGSFYAVGEIMKLVVYNKLYFNTYEIYV